MKLVGSTISNITICILILFSFTFTVSRAQIAIIINPNNPITNLSITQLQQIYLGQKTTFSAGNNIDLAEDATLKEEFYSSILNWKPLRVKKHWMNLIFSGKVSSAPKEFNHTEDLIQFVAKNKNAIAFIHYSLVPNNVKIITLDRLEPLAADYPLKR